MRYTFLLLASIVAYDPASAATLVLQTPGPVGPDCFETTAVQAHTLNTAPSGWIAVRGRTTCEGGHNAVAVGLRIVAPDGAPVLFCGRSVATTRDGGTVTGIYPNEVVIVAEHCEGLP